MGDGGIIKLGVLSDKGTVCIIVLNSVSYNSDVSGNNNSAVELLPLRVGDIEIIKLGVLSGRVTVCTTLLNSVS